MKHKHSPNMLTGILFFIIAFSIISVGIVTTEDKSITGMSVGMESVTGMAVSDNTIDTNSFNKRIGDTDFYVDSNGNVYKVVSGESITHVGTKYKETKNGGGGVPTFTPIFQEGAWEQDSPVGGTFIQRPGLTPEIRYEDGRLNYYTAQSETNPSAELNQETLQLQGKTIFGTKNEQGSDPYVGKEKTLVASSSGEDADYVEDSLDHRNIPKTSWEYLPSDDYVTFSTNGKEYRIYTDGSGRSGEVNQDGEVIRQMDTGEIKTEVRSEAEGLGFCILGWCPGSDDVVFSRREESQEYDGSDDQQLASLDNLIDYYSSKVEEDFLVSYTVDGITVQGKPGTEVKYTTEKGGTITVYIPENLDNPEKLITVVDGHRLPSGGVRDMVLEVDAVLQASSERQKAALQTVAGGNLAAGGANLATQNIELTQLENDLAQAVRSGTASEIEEAVNAYNKAAKDAASTLSGKNTYKQYEYISSKGLIILEDRKDNIGDVTYSTSVGKYQDIPLSEYMITEIKNAPKGLSITSEDGKSITFTSYARGYLYDGELIPAADVEKKDQGLFGYDEKEQKKIRDTNKETLPTYSRTLSTYFDSSGNENQLRTYEATMNYYAEENSDGETVWVGEGVKKDVMKGGFLSDGATEYYYKKDGKTVTISEDGETIKKDGTLITSLSEEDQKLVDAAKASRSQQRWRTGWSSFAQMYSIGSGYGGYASFFMEDEDLEEWRENVDENFARYIDVEYWTSEICANQHLIDNEQKGVAYVDSKQGFASVAAHVEGSRSNPVDTPHGLEYLYKITFSVKNGDYEKDPAAVESLRFNVQLSGNRVVNIFKNKISLEKGGSYTMSRSSAFVQYSTSYYDKVCIIFDEVPDSWQMDGNAICNSLEGPKSASTPYNTPKPEEGATAQEPEEESDVAPESPYNDI